ncbi:hypothetical protein SAMN05660282_01707 [Corynebacterium spheniscorum]|uniref:Uncharacterized protein n=1 Tax=Corynebacterium spheniscorum TaxID=185761 RepID=A0A1I2U295_9CORY|nr:hypothetical protein SAMN05660282_01707 [Corynebacterium spheniscorum]
MVTVLNVCSGTCKTDREESVRGVGVLAPSSPKAAKFVDSPAGNVALGMVLVLYSFAGGSRKYAECDKPRHDAHEASDEDSF